MNETIQEEPELEDVAGYIGGMSISLPIGRALGGELAKALRMAIYMA